MDTGIARGALADTIAFVKTSSRPWIDSGVEHAWQDPYTIQAVGDLTLRLHAAEALLERSGHAVDGAVASPDAESVAAAQLAVAEAKILSTEIAIAATNKAVRAGRHAVDVGCAQPRPTLAQRPLPTRWHDPVRWKYAILGNHALNGIKPPLHAWS